MTDHEKYNVNFFKPLTDHARANKKLIITLAVIWAVAVFGFQILLMLLNQPTPEKNFTTFESIWPAIVENTDTGIETKQDFSRILLSVLGKNIAVKENHKTVLMKALSWTVYSMLSDSVKPILKSEPIDETIKIAKETIGLASTGFDKIMADLLPISLIKVETDQLCEKCKAELPKIMELYLVHNQSVLTNFTFIGFPFHYWYTAQFLLIMFVVLCLIYAKQIDRINQKYDFVEET